MSRLQQYDLDGVAPEHPVISLAVIGVCMAGVLVRGMAKASVRGGRHRLCIWVHHVQRNSNLYRYPKPFRTTF